MLNANNYFFTQTKYINSTTAVSAVRNPEGKMALVKIDLTNGTSEILTPFSFNVLGYPVVKGDTVYFSMMNNNADKIFAVNLSNKNIYRVTNNLNGVYYPAVNAKGDLLFSSFTASGYRLTKQDIQKGEWKKFEAAEFTNTENLYTSSTALTTFLLSNICSIFIFGVLTVGPVTICSSLSNLYKIFVHKDSAISLSLFSLFSFI